MAGVLVEGDVGMLVELVLDAPSSVPGEHRICCLRVVLVANVVPHSCCNRVPGDD